MVPFDSFLLFSIYLSFRLSLFFHRIFLLLSLFLPLTHPISTSIKRFCSFFTGPTPIPTIGVLLVHVDALQTLPPLRLFLSVSVSVSGEDVSAASFRSQKQPDHHPRDHSSHLWNDRNGVARYVSGFERTLANANYSKGERKPGRVVGRRKELDANFNFDRSRVGYSVSRDRTGGGRGETEVAKWLTVAYVRILLARSP